MQLFSHNHNVKSHKFHIETMQLAEAPESAVQFLLLRHNVCNLMCTFAKFTNAIGKECK